MEATGHYARAIKKGLELVSSLWLGAYPNDRGASNAAVGLGVLTKRTTLKIGVHRRVKT